MNANPPEILFEVLWGIIFNKADKMQKLVMCALVFEEACLKIKICAKNVEMNRCVNCYY